MKITIKLLGSYLLIALLVFFINVYSVGKNEKILRSTTERDLVMLARSTLDGVDQLIYNRLGEFRLYAGDSTLRQLLAESHQTFEAMSNLQEYIHTKDQEWSSLPKEVETPFIRAITENSVSEDLRNRLRIHEKTSGQPVYGEVFVTNRYGVNVAQTGKTSDYYQADETWWQMAKEVGFYTGDITFDESANIESQTIAVRVNDENGSFMGVIKAIYNFQDLISYLEELYQKRRGDLESEFFSFDTLRTLDYQLATQEGIIFFNSKGPHLVKEGKETRPSFLLQLLDKGTPLKKTRDQTGRLFVHAASKGYQDYPGTGWILLLSVDTDEVFTPIKELENQLILFALGATGLALVLGFVSSYKVVTPIFQLKGMMTKVTRGDFDVEVHTTRKDELGQLIQTFGEMARQLKMTTASVYDLNKEIAEREKTEQKIKAMTAATQDGILMMDDQGLIQYWNEAAEKIFGYSKEEVLGKNLHQLLVPARYHKDFQKGFEAFRKSGQGPVIGNLLELHGKRKNGTEFPVELSISAVKLDERWHSVGIVRNIEERKLREEELKSAHAALLKSHTELQNTQLQLIQAERFDSIGRLAAGVAHEVKNPLAIIQMGAQYLSKISTAENVQIAEVIGDIKEAVKRANDIIKELLEFANPDTGKMTSEALNPMVERTLSFIKHFLKKKKINVQVMLEESLPFLMLDKSKIEQVLINLLVNAVDAMPERGTLTVKTYAKELTQPGKNVGSRKTDCFRVGETVVVTEIEDTGPGIPLERLPKIYDPFFTTKPVGEGTGLGLSIARKIVEMHHGILDIQNREEGGVRATLMLRAEGS